MYTANPFFKQSGYLFCQCTIHFQAFKYVTFSTIVEWVGYKSVIFSVRNHLHIPIRFQTTILHVNCLSIQGIIIRYYIRRKIFFFCYFNVLTNSTGHYRTVDLPRHTPFGHACNKCHEYARRTQDLRV